MWSVSTTSAPCLYSRLMPPAALVRMTRANAHAAKHAHRKRDFLRGIAFVQVHAALHGGYGDVGNFPNHHLSGVSDGGGAREQWNICVGNSCCIGEFVGKPTQPRAQHQADLWAKRSLREQNCEAASACVKSSILKTGNR